MGHKQVTAIRSAMCANRAHDDGSNAVIARIMSMV